MQNKVILLTGPGGSGKTTIAQLLKKKYDYVWIDGDEIDTEFFPNKGQWDPVNIDKKNKSHDKIVEKTKELFDQGKTVVVDYIIYDNFLEYFNKFKKAFGDSLEIKILLPSKEETIKRDLERECWTTGTKKIGIITKKLEALRNQLGAENYIDTSAQTPEETLERYFR